MILPEYFISCDWGTSNFRLRVVETQSLKVLDQIQTNVGIKALNEQFLASDTETRLNVFGDYLATQLLNFQAEHRQHLVVMSGMASSNIGLEELPYAQMPFDGSGENLLWKKITLKNDLNILLISGVKTQNSMMRGEEIQAIGLEDLLKPYTSGILLLPGTHSKHLAYQNEQFTTMKTFMTGELFALLSEKSILAGSVAAHSFGEKEKIAFGRGVKLGLSENFSEHLFSVRANTVLHQMPHSENYYFLSGLLIGNELAYLQNKAETLFLCAAEPVFSLYKTALETIVHSEKLILFDASHIVNALLNGQRKILKLYVA
jgi:2-dehydro-3-deoxygalactonokinase